MRRIIVSLLLFGTSVPYAANPDGQIDPTFGVTDGRTSIGYLESFTPDLRAFVRSDSSGQYWLFADDRDDAAALYSARLDAEGIPDPGYGLVGDGRRRTPLPAALIPQAEALSVTSAALQADGKALVAGGLYSPDGAPGAFPAVVCRLLGTGALDPTYDGDGCRSFRSQLSPDESCRVTDIAVDAAGLAVVVGNCEGPTIGGRPFVARLAANGALDIEFNGGLGIVLPAEPLPSIESQQYTSVVALPDGRIAVLGEFAMFSNSVADIELGMLQFDNGGGYDAQFSGNGFVSFAFDLGGDNHDRARDLVRRPDGRLLALGEAKRSDVGGIRLLLAQVTADGTPDAAFGPGGKRSDALDGSGERTRISALELDDLGRAIVAASDVATDPAANGNFGTEFRFGFVPGVPPEAPAELHITSLVATTGTVSSPHNAISIPFAVTPGIATVISLPATIHAYVNDDGITARAVRVTAAAPVSVVATNGRSFTADTMLLTPVEHLGKRYRLSAWGAGLGVGSELVVAATEPATTVTITPRVATDAHAAGVPFQVVLQPGEVYMLGANIGVNDDLTGTTIVADKPVAVTGGHSCAEVPDEAEFCDLAAEQQPPLERWGTRFFATPSINRPAGVVVRVLADRSPTLVWFDGVLVATLMEGQVHTATLAAPTAIVTSEPALATQLEIGCAVDKPDPDTCLGDPSLVVLEPVTRWSRDLLATVRDPVFDGPSDSLLRIVLPTSAAASATIDGAALPAGNFTPIGGSGYSMAQIARTPGLYRLQAAAPMSATIVTIGSGEGLAHNAAAVDAAPSGDDLLLRFAANGSRDATFGAGGLARIDHTVLSGGNQDGLDLALRAIPSGAGIVAASAFVSPVSQQHLPVVYRVAGAGLFRDGFE